MNDKGREPACLILGLDENAFSLLGANKTAEMAPTPRNLGFSPPAPAHLALQQGEDEAGTQAACGSGILEE